MSTTIIHPHITTDKDIGNGEPIIKGTRTRVRNIIGYYRLGYSVDELAQALPHLSLAKIHDALSFYFDNQAQIDQYIEQNNPENVKKKFAQ